jgi:hypothetical protein
MLSPIEFGNYLAVGTEKRTRGQAMFFEVDQELAKDVISQEYIEERCVPKENGDPKSSVYLSIYRVLETIPLNALKNFYLVTDDGKVLELEKAEYDLKKEEIGLHLYQELCPVTPRIASVLPPSKFSSLVTDTSKSVSVPKLVFVELELGELAKNPENGITDNLPYYNMEHLRDCLTGLKKGDGKMIKTVIRFFQGDLLYRTLKNGFFVGSQDTFIYYPFPSFSELEGKYFSWWRSALTTGIR